MERARARVVKVRESRERERRDIPSSMATREKREAGGGQRERGGGEREGQTARVCRTNRTEGVTAGADGAEGAGQMLWGGFER